MPAFRGFDRVNVADNVGNRHIRRRELFDKTLFAIDPVNLCFVAVQFDLLAPERAQRLQTDYR